MITDNFVFFWGGTFSQWYLSPFIIDGIVYNCCEQYMMAKKALIFNDLEAYEKIMSSADPSYQKAQGRKIKDFDKHVWEKHCRQIVFDANWAKFTQNDDLYNELGKTGTREIVEASPEDTIWGIGLHESDPRCLDKTQWLGTNWLGEALVQVREKIVNDLVDIVTGHNIPKNLNECIDALSKVDGVEDFKKEAEENISAYHHTIGRELRNNWGLWDDTNDLCKFFHGIGIKHGDDMSDIILVSFHRHLNKVPIDLKGQVIKYWKHWSKYNKNLLPPNINGVSDEYIKHYELYKKHL